MKKFKNLFIILGVFLSLVGCGQEYHSSSRKSMVKGNKTLIKETREISGYEGVILKGSFNVVLTDAPQGEITIKGEENIIPLVLTEINEGNLELNLNTEQVIVQYNKLTVYVPAQDIKYIELKGSGDLINKGNLKQKELKINLQGSGDIDLKNLIIEKTETVLNGSGGIKLSGVSEVFNINILGSGNVKAKNFITNEAEVYIKGSGDANIHAKESFSGNIFGSGNITVAGKPDQVNQSIKGSGKIQIL